MNIQNVDWELWIERTGISIFLSTFFAHIENGIMEKVIGGGFHHQLFFRDGNKQYWMRSKTDMDEMRKAHVDFILKTPRHDIKGIFDKAQSLLNTAETLIVEAKSLSDGDFLMRSPEFLRQLEEILLYTTSIPYFLLSALESLSAEEFKTHNEIKERCELLRADSKYLALQSAIGDRLLNLLEVKHSLLKGSMKNASWQEILSALEQDIVPNVGELKNRDRSVFWFEAGVVCFSDKSELYKVVEDILHVDTEITEVKGSIACKGSASGAVKIVNHPDEMGKVQEGDIIVSRNTNPSLMPVLSVCAAIVTDEGGIACHAAIVSRELGKPCVIGTKIATKVFKDGDLVEVDAERGVVRIIT